MSKCFQKIGVSEQEMLLCSGLPFVGERTLQESELRTLRRKAEFYWAKGFALILLIPFLIALFPWSLWHEDWVKANIPYIGEYVMAISLLLWLFGLPLAIFLSRDCFRYEDVLTRAINSGVVRRFEGYLNVHDKTDAIRLFLTKKGFLKTESQASNRIELFREDNIIYGINGSRPSKLLHVELTSAALPDASTPCFSLPAAWGIPESEIELERRRLSEGEIEEVQSYAKEQWRYVRFLFLLGIWVFGVTEIFTMGFLEMEPHRSHVVSVGCAIALCIAIFYRRRGRAERLEKDASNGWAFIYYPTENVRKSAGKDLPQVPVEFLPFSNVLWIIDGKPAAWRRNSSKPG